MAVDGIPKTAALATGSFFDEIPALAAADPADPYPAYDAIVGAPFLAASGAVAVLTRYADCSAVIRHRAVVQRRSASPVFRGLRSAFLNVLDPPEHTRIRALVNQAFTPRSVELLRPWLVTQVDTLLDQVDPDRPFDIIAGLAYPLPLTAICQLLDVPLEDRERVMSWSKPITLGADLLAGRRSRVEQTSYRRALREFRLYVQALMVCRRDQPGEDLLSALMGSREEGTGLTEREIVTTTIGLLITGHETTVSLIGHGVIALARFPELRARVAEDPSFADAFVEEVLRYDAPVQATLRVAGAALTVGGVHIAEGTAMLLLLGAANRDAAQFAHPERFDVERPTNRTHLAFGGGPHFCVGASLGRLEARLAVTAVARRLRGVRLSPGGTTYDRSMMMRTQTRLQVEVDSVAPASSGAT